MSVSDIHPNLVVSSAIKAQKILFTKMRDASTSSEDFVKYSKRSMRLLAEDALAEFPLVTVSINTPCGYAQLSFESKIRLRDSIFVYNRIREFSLFISRRMLL